MFSSIDHGGRYAYAQQPIIAQWNLARLAESLLPLVQGEQEQAIEKLVAILSTFPERYGRHHLAGARAKLGLTTQDADDADLYAAFLAVLQETEADFTASFAALPAQAEAQPGSPAPPLAPAFAPWLARWRARLAREPGGPGEAARQMRAANPVIIPRNLRVEEALTAAEAGDLAPTLRLLEVISKPFCETAANEAYRTGAPAGSPAYCTFCGT